MTSTALGQVCDSSDTLKVIHFLRHVALAGVKMSLPVLCGVSPCGLVQTNFLEKYTASIFRAEMLKVEAVCVGPG
jgi:hypothetical protein